jgi:DNA polymerase elongation subunit (family B)
MRELLKLNEEKLIFYDIETARVVKDLIPDSPLYNSWDYKVNKDGEMSEEEVMASYVKESGLYPEFSRVVSIVVGKILNGGITLITFDDSDEFALLSKFNSLLERNAADKLVGFVNVGFDTPFTFKRMLLNGIQPNDKVDSSGLKPWEVEEIDLGKLWQGTSFSRASLINISTAFGLPSPKDDISGADVGNVYWNEGEEGLARISKYCRKDVVTTINIFKKMRLEEPLKVLNAPLSEQPLLENLFGGAAYGKAEKAELKKMLSAMTPDERNASYVILNSVVSGAKGKKTKLTKAHVTALKKELDV